MIVYFFLLFVRALVYTAGGLWAASYVYEERGVVSVRARQCSVRICQCGVGTVQREDTSVQREDTSVRREDSAA